MQCIRTKLHIWLNLAYLMNLKFSALPGQISVNQVDDTGVPDLPLVWIRLKNKRTIMWTVLFVPFRSKECAPLGFPLCIHRISRLNTPRHRMVAHHCSATLQHDSHHSSHIKSVCVHAVSRERESFSLLETSLYHAARWCLHIERAAQQYAQVDKIWIIWSFLGNKKKVLKGQDSFSNSKEKNQINELFFQLPVANDTLCCDTSELPGSSPLAAALIGSPSGGSCVSHTSSEF